MKKKVSIIAMICFSIFIMTACNNGSGIKGEIIANKNIIKRDEIKIKEKYQLARGDKAPIFKTEFEFLSPRIYVLASDEDYLWAAGGTSFDEDMNVLSLEDDKKILYRSDDLGNTWEEYYRFNKKIEGVHITPEDVMLVSITDDRWSEEANTEIYRLDMEDEKFKQVLDLESGSALNWNFTSDDEGYIFISEYGYKSLPNNARRIYRSEDRGATWKIVYEPEEAEGHHNHIIAIDRDDNDIIYQSIGDDDKRILKSEDRGETWDVILRGYHPTSMVQLDDHILWGLDNVPVSGILKMDKDSYEKEMAFRPPEGLGGSIYDMLYVDNTIYVGLLSYSQPDNHWDGSIFVSKDEGETWEDLCIWPKLSEESGIGFENFVAKDGYGFIDAKVPVIVDEKEGSYSGTIRFKLLD